MSALQAIKDRLKEAGNLAEAEEVDLSQIKIGKFTDDVKKCLEKCKNLSVLILNNCDLESLDNLPKLKLNIIDVSDNKLNDSAIASLAVLPSLNRIIFSNNKVENLDSLKPLSQLKQLSEVDFIDNPVASKDNYRTWLFENIPTLEAIDNLDKDGNPVEEEEFEEGSEDEEEEEYSDSQYSESESESEKPKKKKK